MPALSAANNYVSSPPLLRYHTSSSSRNTNLLPLLRPSSSSFPSLSKSISLKPKTLETTIAPPKYSAEDGISLATPSPAHSNLNLKARLAHGETLYGLFLLTFSPTLAEIAGLAGYDFVVVDMEHGYGGISDALPCLHALAAASTAAVLRIPESSPTWAKKALDLGPQGIMFPMIDSPKLAKKAVSYCRFPPNGVRGSAHPVVRASKYGMNEGYLERYEEELLIMCQVETEEGAKRAGEIAAVEGVDCVQMGPLDLSGSLGYLWDPGHKKVREVVGEVEKAVLGGGGKGACLAGFAMPHDGPEQLRRRGYRMVSGAVDVGLFRSAAAEDVRRFRTSTSSDDATAAAANNEEDIDEDDKYWSE
ncbi:hypothetical protein Scep_005972 [Stephania cephalantha]|uniref:HpcH/HpaI aldolase/citrate lyase domain-containing protein n=1 Tax=Stephania cephalantha TaxID=152367 RepID=A0AAP0K8C8_9MAGN